MNDVIKSINVGGIEYDIQAKELTKVTYAELKELRDNGGLVAGHLYRITDYEFTTKQVETKSAGHVFDIIVLAVAENELSHIARAIAHEGDTYFDGNDLGAWELWYELDNDAEKYAWADAENGKGIIYRMIDEKRNDCPYDFKNALFYNEKLTTGATEDKYYYTFSYIVKGVLYDGTVEKQVTTCYGNSMGVTWTLLGKKEMNKNVFVNTSFRGYCYSNTFGDSCYSNTFGDYCYSNTFGGSCYSNTFGGYCNSNTFGGSCYSNTFGSSCNNNTFGNYCNSNTFGNSCSYNTFNSSCYSNTFGYSCYSNTFGSSCYSNTFGDYCNSNTFGYSCYSNTFGSSCNNNTFGFYCYDNTFGDSCSDNTFGDSCSDNTFGNETSHRRINSDKTSITLNEEYFDDGSGQLVPIKHPDLSTQPSILPYKFAGQYVYEQLIPMIFYAGAWQIESTAATAIPVSEMSILEISAVTLYQGKLMPIQVTYLNYNDEGIYLNFGDNAEGYPRINGTKLLSIDNVYARVVYTSMSDEAVYYYDGGYGDSVGLPTSGLLVRIVGQTEVSGIATNNGAMMTKISEEYYHIDSITQNPAVTDFNLTFYKDNGMFTPALNKDLTEVTPDGSFIFQSYGVVDVYMNQSLTDIPLITVTFYAQ